MLGGTLLLTLAFSLNDGSAAQSEAHLQRVRFACDSQPKRHGAAPDLLNAAPVERCLDHESKK
jgi:hypothetical protein